MRTLMKRAAAIVLVVWLFQFTAIAQTVREITLPSNIVAADMPDGSVYIGNNPDVAPAHAFSLSSVPTEPAVHYHTGRIDKAAVVFSVDADDRAHRVYSGPRWVPNDPEIVTPTKTSTRTQVRADRDQLMASSFGSIRPVSAENNGRQSSMAPTTARDTSQNPVSTTPICYVSSGGMSYHSVNDCSVHKPDVLAPVYDVSVLVERNLRPCGTCWKSRAPLY